jgi:hypothetical protein
MNRRRSIVLLVAAVALSSCGGVADSRAFHQVTIRVNRHGHALPERAISIAMGDARKGRFGKPQQTKTDRAGRAQATFETMWGAAFLVIPPLGLVPSRAPKPDYAVTVGTERVIVSPQTASVIYRWEKGSWNTDASIEIP